MELCVILMFFFFKHKTAYEMRISDWSSDVCSSDLQHPMVYLEPALHRRCEHLDRFVGKAAAPPGQQFVMPARLGAEYPAIGAVGKQQFQPVVGVGGYRNGVVQAFQHGHETFVRGDRKSTRLNSSH